VWAGADGTGGTVGTMRGMVACLVRLDHLRWRTTTRRQTTRDRI
jgi:hypothetical protein